MQTRLVRLERMFVYGLFRGIVYKKILNIYINSTLDLPL